LVSAVPLGDLARAVARRARRAQVTPFPVDAEGRRLAADALHRAPLLFTAEPLVESYRHWFPDGAARLLLRAEQILEHRVELFGRSFDLGPTIDWLRDPSGEARFDADGDPADALDAVLRAGGGDAKLTWELQRCAHLVELGAASRLNRALEAPARAQIAAQLDAFLDQTNPGRGFAYASPLEVALRSIHWLAAIELAGGARAFPRSWVERVAGALLGDLHWLWASREEQGVAPANHLLGDLVGAWALALALDGAPGVRPLIRRVRAALEREAVRQVGPDGAHFEASTGYHRFALELLLIANKYAHPTVHTLDVWVPLQRMFRYLRGIAQPDGTDPGFGDADDARMIPIVPRHPRQVAYLFSVGAALFESPSLRAPHVPFSEEALWLAGPDAQRMWQWLQPTPDPPSATFPSGGVHVLRDRDLYVAFRAGSYGQHGVGGHAHNDQLSLVVHAAGAPLLIDAGTGCYTRDPLLRDRLRSTSAHSTVVVGAAEQSPLYEGRPFALPDRARASKVTLEDTGAVATLEAAHHGYRRLPARVTHRRRVELHRVERVLIVEDHLEGRGDAAVEIRWLVAGRASHALWLDRLDGLRRLLGAFDPSQVIDLDGRALLVPLGDYLVAPRLERGLASDRWQSFTGSTLVAAAARLTLPRILKHAIVFVEPQ
jgi:hypothetical protein